jgi:hypothetical protein
VQRGYAPRYRRSSPAKPVIEDGLASRSLDSSGVGAVAFRGNPRKLLTRRLRLGTLLRSRWRASLKVSPWSRISGPLRRPAPAGGPPAAVGDNAASTLVTATKRRRADDGRFLHDDKSRSLHALHQALGEDRRYEFICTVDARAPVVCARRMGSRLFTASLRVTRKRDYLRAAWEDDRPWPTRRAPIVDVVP